MKKDNFLKETNRGKDFFVQVYRRFGIELKPKSSTKFKNTTCLFYRDTTPACSIYYNKKRDVFCFKDFGSDEYGNQYSGDVFTFAGHLFDIDPKTDFPKLLEYMEAEMLGYKMSYVEKYDNIYLEDFEELFTDYELLIVEPTEEAVDYFAKYELNLNDFRDVNQIRGYRILNESGKAIETKEYKNWEKDVRIAFSNQRGQSKIRRIEPKHYRTLGDYSSNGYYFGEFDYAEYIDEPFFIVGGEKDVMTIQALGFNAVCLQSESSDLPRRLRKELTEAGFKMISLYDTDIAGVSGAKKLNNKWGISIADLSNIIPEEYKSVVKDVSDYIYYKLDKPTLINFLKSFEPPQKTKLENGIIVVEENSEPESKKDESKDLQYLKDLQNLTFEEDEVPPENLYEGLDDNVFDILPEFLKEVCYPLTEKHERDVVLLSTLGVISNIIPVKGVYDNRTIYPNLFIFITAKPSAGKGVLKWVKRLAEPIHKNKYKAYKIALDEYNNLDSEEKKGSTKPILQTFFIPGNASVSAITNQLSKNNGIGVIIESEADALNIAMNSDWGNYSEILRKAFEFETISMLRKDKENSFEIDDPKLSVVLTGTQNQLLEFIPSPENGLFSRFIFMEFPLIKKWKNVHDNTVNFDNYYNSLANQLLEFYVKLNGKRLKVELTDKQKIDFNNRFRKYQKQYDTLFGDEIIASIRRIGNIHFRICMLLTGIRNMNNAEEVKLKTKCSDDDFEIANILTEFFLKNLKNIYSYLPETSIATKQLKRKEALLYEALQKKFNYSTFKKISADLKIAESTAYNYLRRFLKNNLVERFEHGVYTKVSL